MAGTTAATSSALERAALWLVDAFASFGNRLLGTLPTNADTAEQVADLAASAVVVYSLTHTMLAFFPLTQPKITRTNYRQKIASCYDTRTRQGVWEHVAGSHAHHGFYGDGLGLSGRDAISTQQREEAIAKRFADQETTSSATADTDSSTVSVLSREVAGDSTAVEASPDAASPPTVSTLATVSWSDMISPLWTTDLAAAKEEMVRRLVRLANLRLPVHTRHTRRQASPLPEHASEGLHRRHTHQRQSSRTEDAEDVTILDVGCGLGGVTRSLAGMFPHARVTGITLSAAQVDRARELTDRDQAHRVHFQVADMMDLPFDTNSFDLIVCLESAQHGTDANQLVAECARVLKPGGTLILAGPCCREPYPRLRFWETIPLWQIRRSLLMPKLHPLSTFVAACTEAGMLHIITRDWSRQAAPTWLHNMVTVVRNMVWVVRCGPLSILNTLGDMHTALHMALGYRLGYVVYGALVASRRPEL